MIKKVSYSSDLSICHNKYPYAYRKQNISFMLHRKNITSGEYKNSKQKDEYEHLYKKNDEKNAILLQMKTDAFGKFFLNFKIIHDRDST